MSARNVNKADVSWGSYEDTEQIVTVANDLKETT